MKRYIDHIGLAFLVLLAALSLTACATSAPISANPVQDVVSVLPPLAGPLDIGDGLKEAKFNFDAATKIGIDMTAESQCVDAVMNVMGLGTTPAPSFVPETKTLIGVGSAGLIRLKQAQSASGSGLTIAPACKQKIADIVIDGGRAGVKALPFGGLLPGLR